MLERNGSPAMTGGWQQLADPTLAGELLDAAAALNRALVDVDPRTLPDFGLGSGLAGVGLFDAYAGAAGLDANGLDRGATRAVTSLPSFADDPRAETSGLFAGLAGVAWAIEHLRAWVPDAGPDSAEYADAALLHLLQTVPYRVWPAGYDLSAGLVGIGVYALERPAGVRRDLLRAVVARLGEQAERTGDLATWWTPPAGVPPAQLIEFPAGYYDLGVAHGVPGVLGLLGRAVASGVTEAGPLLDAGVRWLLHRRRVDGRAGSFPHVTGREGALPRGSALSWRYGDPGVAAILLDAGRRRARPDWLEVGYQVARAAALRTLRHDGLPDASLAGGTAGLAHVMNRIFQATGDEIFRDAALHELRRTLQQRRPGSGPEPYLFVADAAAGAVRPPGSHPGLLRGLAGVGLCLLAAATTLPPRWDRCLLLDIPPLPS